MKKSEVDIFNKDLRKNLKDDDLRIEPAEVTYQNLKDTFSTIRDNFFQPYVWGWLDNIETAKEKFFEFTTALNLMATYSDRCYFHIACQPSRLKELMGILSYVDGCDLGDYQALIARVDEMTKKMEENEKTTRRALTQLDAKMKECAAEKRGRLKEQDVK